MKTIKNYTLTGIQTSLVSNVERFHGAFEATRFQGISRIKDIFHEIERYSHPCFPGFF